MLVPFQSLANSRDCQTGGLRLEDTYDAHWRFELTSEAVGWKEVREEPTGIGQIHGNFDDLKPVAGAKEAMAFPEVAEVMDTDAVFDCPSVLAVASTCAAKNFAELRAVRNRSSDL